MKTYSPLNDILVVLLWISIIGNAYKMISGVGRFDGSFIAGVELSLGLVSLMGAGLILRLNKWGYWMMVGARMLVIVIGLFMASLIDVGSLLIQNLGQVALLSLLMLLKKDGRNAYQVLWLKMPTEEDEDEDDDDEQYSVE